MFEISYNKKFSKRGGRMDENMPECDHCWWAQGSHYTTYFGVYLYIFTMKSCFAIVFLKAILCAPPCCPRMELLSTAPGSSRTCAYSPTTLVTVPAPCPQFLPVPHALGSGTAVSSQTLRPMSCPHAPCSVPLMAHLEAPSAKGS